MEDQVQRKARKCAGLLFGAAALISVGFFEFRSGFLAGFGYMALTAYLTFVTAMPLLAMGFSRWYASESRLFEILVIPALVALISALAGACSFALLELLVQTQTTHFPPTAGEVAAYSLYGGWLFLRNASPVLLPAVLLASFLVSRVSKNAQASNAA